MLVGQLDSVALGPVPAKHGRRCPTATCKTSPHGGYHYWRSYQYEPKGGTTGVMHWAWDLSGSANETMVYAPENALVYETATGESSPWTGFQPGLVLLLGDSGVYHVLGHMRYAGILVKKGQRVEIGQPLGVMGISHTHWEIRKNRTPEWSKYPTYWQAHGPNSIDPAVWLAGGRGSVGKTLAVIGTGLLIAGVVTVGASFLRR